MSLLGSLRVCELTYNQIYGLEMERFEASDIMALLSKSQLLNDRHNITQKLISY